MKVQFLSFYWFLYWLCFWLPHCYLVTFYTFLFCLFFLYILLSHNDPTYLFSLEILFLILRTDYLHLHLFHSPEIICVSILFVINKHIFMLDKETDAHKANYVHLHIIPNNHLPPTSTSRGLYAFFIDWLIKIWDK